MGEFVIGMLTKLGLVDEEDVAPFLSQFAALDKSGDGRLTRQDLEEVANGYTARAKAGDDHKGEKKVSIVKKGTTSKTGTGNAHTKVSPSDTPLSKSAPPRMSSETLESCPPPPPQVDQEEPGLI